MARLRDAVGGMHMAKRKRERALFELLSQERGRGRAKPDTQGREAGAETPPARPPGRAEPTPTEPPRRAAPTVVTRKAVVAVGGVRLSAYHLVIAGVLIACLCYVFYLLGAEFGQPDDGLPEVPAEPTMEDIQNQPAEGTLVEPEPTRPALGRRIEPESEPEPQTEPQTEPEPTGPQPEPEPEPEPEPTGPQYRVRVARLDVSRPDAIDALRAYLARSGIETDLTTRRGYHVIYSRRRFTDKTEADQLADQVNKALAAFEAETGVPTSKDAYTVQIKRE